MSNLRTAGLGPIVGHVTPTTARLWIRAGDPQDSGAHIARDRRTVGVIRIVAANGHRRRDRAAYYFRLQREYDRTGYFTLGSDTGIGDANPSPPLEPNTRYEVRVGTLTIDDPNPDDESISNEVLGARLPSARVWAGEIESLSADESLATFTTPPGPGQEQDDLSFLLGSCRYPGLLWKAKHADKIFGPMLEEALGRDDRSAVSMVLMVGDQIYADRMNRKIDLARADTFEEFQERYLTAFGSNRMRTLLRSVATYMILDDHEIEDNWTQDRIRTVEGRRVFNLALNAYMSYQWLHGPRNYGPRLFYSFERDGYPFFVLDSRTQRYMDDVVGSLEDNHLLGRPRLDDEEPSQLDHLLHWLGEQDRNVPKFIVSPSVFVPNPMDAREGREGSDEQKVRWKEESDSWPAFPSTRRALLQRIVEIEAQNVIFLSGDIHCSNVASLSFSGSPAAAKLRAFSVTSSAFYWPFPFADGAPSNYVHDSTAGNQRDTFAVDDQIRMDYKAFNFTQEDNFCRIDLDRKRHLMTVVPYGDDGRQISTGGWLGIATRPLRAELELAPW